MKKQLAVLMAAATAVTTVAPVVASADTFTTENVSASEVSAKVKEALASRYTNKTEDGLPGAKSDEVAAYLNSTYAVFVDDSVATTDAELERYGLKKLVDTPYNGVNFADVPTSVHVVTDAAKFASLAESKAASTPKVYIVDKGVKDGKESFVSTNKRYVADADFNDADTQVKLSEAFNTLNAEFTKPGVKYVDKLEPAVFGPDAKEVKVTLKSGTKLTLKIGGEALDLEKAKNSAGAEIDLNATNTQAVLDTITSFATQENANKKPVTLDIVDGDTNVYKLADLVKTTIEMPTIYTTENGYTNAGADFVNGINKANKAKDAGETGSAVRFNYQGVNYELKNAITYADATIDKSGDKYVLRFTADVKDANDTVVSKTLQFAIEGKTQKDLARVLDDLKQKRTVVAGRFTRLIGADRFETAIEVSKEAFDAKTADSVVVVGSNAVIDGLSAAPLASAENAPVLLADSKNGLNNATLNEIERACKSLKNKTVYIVGGENSVPASVKKQLEDKFGAVVVRLSGADRFETSLDVARRLGYNDKINSDNVFLVGGEGAADAMSVSAVAATKNSAEKVSPIVVVPKTNIPRNTREFLASKNFVNAYVIGGEVTLSSTVYSDAKYLNSANNTNRVRLSGADRFATNARIVEEFYTNPNNPTLGSKQVVKSAFFASGDSKYLVDAQTAGSFAAAKKGPIVLTGSKLTADQLDLFSKNKPLSELKDNVYQVGGVVSADAMKAVVEKLGL
ncbi:cell wall-binding repeat-containing protein [Peptostreptococcus porci]|uniref:cell wall-binding repeat-containing protein n=1 Tax=Peptostreptococcus porci TaxID=2652282 RepID=UPI0023EFEFBF|nr:cell wall-binding repeat-containing protein [Peptostreptococcus porci]MDD7183062.1 cell wall-binding repeat-containing protein [Peptostreptococcus porci]